MNARQLFDQFAQNDAAVKESARVRLLNLVRELANRGADSLQTAELDAIDGMLRSAGLSRKWLVESVAAIQTRVELRRELSGLDDATLRHEKAGAETEYARATKALADAAFSADEPMLSRLREAKAAARERRANVGERIATAESSRRRLADLECKRTDLFAEGVL